MQGQEAVQTVTNVFGLEMKILSYWHIMQYDIKVTHESSFSALANKWQFATSNQFVIKCSNYKN